ncbi:YveK family protein [Williamsia sterculiae]|uniref:Capsular polysaccharide biosynthesis protein n=1 Tax=Williamsia sterculiae TaxID=1344003 RepID=A0A1N7CZW3_9NOCA|nr:hypothetical protein [Williamsia sterculiae]SIR69121.1 Capsular polysaccharide biosynthesis protein [Williamsia sterculiae]
MRAPTGVLHPTDYWARIVGGRWLILAAAILAGVVGALATLFVVPTHYSATSTVFIEIPGPVSTNAALNGNRGALVRVDSYAQMAVGPDNLARAAERIGMGSPTALQGHVVAIVSPGAAVLDITATADDPRTAPRMADAVADSLADLVATVETDGAGGAHAQIRGLDPATGATGAAPSVTTGVVAGVMVGALWSVVLLLMFDVGGGRIRSRGEVARIVGESVIEDTVIDDEERHHDVEALVR